jgi:hypothetical protein
LYNKFVTREENLVKLKNYFCPFHAKRAKSPPQRRDAAPLMINQALSRK